MTESKRRVGRPRHSENPNVVLRPVEVRKATLREAWANDDSDLFGDFAVSKTPLRDRYASTEQVRALAGTNGRRVIGSFTGCGGSATGFTWAGWDEITSVEFVKVARDAYAANYRAHIIEPAHILSAASTWIDQHSELVELTTSITPAVREGGFSVVLFPDKIKRGAGFPATINWELTLESASAGGPEAIALFEQMRHDVTLNCFNEAVLGGHAPMWGDDIRGLDPYAMMTALNLAPGELDCFESSPPCKSFSISGMRSGGWGSSTHYSEEREQRTDDLFMEYVRILKALRPKSFVAENVAGIEHGDDAREFLAALMGTFADLGYTAETKLMSADHYGIPQARPRVFFQGIRTDLIDPLTGESARPMWPERSLDTYTLGDALEAAGESPASELAAVDVSGYEIGRYWKALPLGGAPKDRNRQLLRCHPDRPAPTITAKVAGNTPAAGPMHPYENRKFTVTELRWIFGFPYDYAFAGDHEEQAERMGRSVPPYLMKQIAECVAAVLDRCEQVSA